MLAIASAVDSVAEHRPAPRSAGTSPVDPLDDVPRDLITPEADLVDKLNLDSIDAIDLMVRLQEITGRKVEPDDFKSVRTIDDVLNLAQKMHAQN